MPKIGAAIAARAAKFAEEAAPPPLKAEVADPIFEDEHGDKVSVGDIEIELLHTPGHTPGSQCFLLDGRLVAGDTLFLEGCGRTDFPGGNVDEMFHSLQALAQLPGDPTIFPGHWYSAEPSAALSDVRNTNYVYRASNLDQWRMLMGG